MSLRHQTPSPRPQLPPRAPSSPHSGHSGHSGYSGISAASTAVERAAYEKPSLNLARTDSAQKGVSRSPFLLAPLPFQLTSHERLLLSRQNLGHPSAIVHAVRFPLSELPSLEFLELRVGDLQIRLPRLNASIAHAKTNRPCFEYGAPWAVKEIVQDGMFAPHPNPDVEMAAVLEAQEERFASQDFAHSPMFTVTVLTSPDVNYGYFVACFNHLIVDGRGALRLVHLLTARGINLPVESFDYPTRLDDTVNLKPDARFMSPIVFREIIVPKLPKPLQKKFKAKDPWPYERIDLLPERATPGLGLISISNDIVNGCKAVGKTRGVRTFHPILKMAYLAAIWRVFGDPSSPHSPSSSGSSSNSLRIVALSSRDERRSKLGHSAVTGCYVTHPEYESKVSGQDKFWLSTRNMAEWMDERGVAVGRFNNGILYHIPDPETSIMDPHYDPALPTGWEQHWHQRANAPAPFRNSIGVHNLGVASLPEGAEDHVWSTTASPYAPVWAINVFSHEGGMRLTAVYRDGCATTREQTNILLRVLANILERIAFNEADSTIERLTK